MGESGEIVLMMGSGSKFCPPHNESFASVSGSSVQPAAVVVANSPFDTEAKSEDGCLQYVQYSGPNHETSF